MGSPAVSPAEPRHASTVVLLRDGACGVEAYLLRRVAGMAFAAGMTVFPGGSVDPADAVVGTPWVGPAPAEWASRLSADEGLARALVCAAVRETFEEAGVLLASAAGSAAAWVPADVSGAAWEAERASLEAGTQSLSELLSRRGLVLRADCLRAWAHWITPESEPRRFDTRFFVAALPDGQGTRDVGGEADRVHWMAPAAAVAACRRGDLPMMPPTVLTLAELSSYATVAEILTAAGSRTIAAILPRTVSRAGEPRRVVLPGEEGYE